MQFIQSNLITIIGIVVGTIAGYLYYANIGCNNGTCEITSKPVNSTAYGALLGGLLFSIFKQNKKKKDDVSGNN